MDITDTLRSLKSNIRSCKEDNEGIIQSQERLSRAQEKELKSNAIIIHGFLDL